MKPERQPIAVTVPGSRCGNYLWIPIVVLLFSMTTGCITKTQLLYEDPVFKATLQEFDKLHIRNKLPGLAASQVPRSLSAYEMSYEYMHESYYELWRESSKGCKDMQVIVAHKNDGSACAFFFCSDSGSPMLTNTLYKNNRGAPWRKTP